jgi:hypothetical protein
LIGFVLLGLFHDILRAVSLATKTIAWPVHTFSHWVAKESRRHPGLKVLHSHSFVCVSMGFVLLAVSFAIEHFSEHFLWSCSIETMRAAGVCPIWEVIAVRLVKV